MTPRHVSLLLVLCLFSLAFSTACSTRGVNEDPPQNQEGPADGDPNNPGDGNPNNPDGGGPADPGDGGTSNSDGGTPDPGEQVGEFGYRFEGVTDTGAPCTTGVRNYRSLAELCLNIQDPVQNQNCAFSERVEKFYEVCPEDQYEFYGSFECRFEVLDSEWTWGDPSEPHLVQGSNGCVGYRPDGVTIKDVFHQWALEGSLLQKELSFTPPATRPAGSSGHWASFTAHRPGNAPSVLKLTSPGEVTHTAVGPHTLRLTCWRTWACR